MHITVDACGWLQPKSYFMVQAFHHPPEQGEAKLIHIALGARELGQCLPSNKNVLICQP